MKIIAQMEEVINPLVATVDVKNGKMVELEKRMVEKEQRIKRLDKTFENVNGTIRGKYGDIRERNCTTRRLIAQVEARGTRNRRRPW